MCESLYGNNIDGKEEERINKERKGVGRDW
jgi:hypothetical protein